MVAQSDVLQISFWIRLVCHSYSVYSVHYCEVNNVTLKKELFCNFYVQSFT